MGWHASPASLQRCNQCAQASIIYRLSASGCLLMSSIVTYPIDWLRY